MANSLRVKVIFGKKRRFLGSPKLAKIFWFDYDNFKEGS